MDHLKIYNVFLDEHHTEIEWNAGGGSRIVEISYMVIGDVPRCLASRFLENEEERINNAFSHLRRSYLMR